MMNEEKQKVFNDFMNEFVKLDINQKNTEIIEKQKIILAYLINYVTEHGIEYEVLKSKEITDIENNSGTNEDYLEAMMVYMQNIEELIGIIINEINS